MTTPHLHARLAALHAADQRDPLTAERTVQDGNDVCQAYDDEFDADDLFFDRNGENPRCLECIARESGLIKERRRGQPGAVLAGRVPEEWEEDGA